MKTDRKVRIHLTREDLDAIIGVVDGAWAVSDEIKFWDELYAKLERARSRGEVSR